jgi:hypothetical protein
VFSFLDFDCESHWPVFESTLADQAPDRICNKFLSKSAIRRWARALGLGQWSLFDGTQKWIRLTEALAGSDGGQADGVAEFGQSVAVLRKPAYESGSQ